MEAVASLSGLADSGMRGCGIALVHALQGGGHEQISLLHAVVLSFQQAPGSGEPPAATGHFASQEEAEGQPECAPGGSRHIAQAQAFLMRTGPDNGAVLVPTGQVGGHRQPLKVLNLQWRVEIRRRQLSVGVSPFLSPEGLAALFKGFHFGYKLSQISSGAAGA
jgi:hypothetical protein